MSACPRLLGPTQLLPCCQSERRTCYKPCITVELRNGVCNMVPAPTRSFLAWLMGYPFANIIAGYHEEGSPNFRRHLAGLVVSPPAAQDPPPAPTRRRPLIYVYDTDPIFNTKIMQYRIARCASTMRSRRSCKQSVAWALSL